MRLLNRTLIFRLMLNLAINGGLLMAAAAAAGTATAPERTLVEWESPAAPGMKVFDAEARALAGGWLGLRAKADSGRGGVAIDVLRSKGWRRAG